MIKELSVIIPVYNGASYIRQALESVVHQTFKGKIHIIVVDDGSTDKSADMVEDFARNCLTESITILLKKKPNGGAASARNMGIACVQTNILMFLDADDVLEPNAIEVMCKQMEADDNLLAVLACANDFVSPEMTESEKKDYPESTLRRNYKGLMCGCALFSKKIFEQIGGFDETLKTRETVAWQLKLRESGVKIKQLEEVLLQRRLHKNNTGRIRQHQGKEECLQIIQKQLKKKKN